VAQERVALANIHALLAALERRQRGAAADAEAHQARRPLSRPACAWCARARAPSARAPRARPSTSVADTTARSGTSRRGLRSAMPLQHLPARMGPPRVPRRAWPQRTAALLHQNTQAGALNWA